MCKLKIASYVAVRALKRSDLNPLIIAVMTIIQANLKLILSVPYN
jgi:hypothetical protein